jgi:Zn-dependent protease with chaperone function
VTLLSFGPLVLSLVGVFTAGLIVRALNPRLAARVLCTLALATSASTGTALVLIALASIHRESTHNLFEEGASMSSVEMVLEWCGDLYDHQAPWWVGALAASVLAIGAYRVHAVRRRWRAAVAPWSGAGPVAVIPGDSAEAFAVPGRPGTVVVGEGLLHALDPDERRVLLTHERAHLDHGHHRYLQIAESTAAAFPFLAPLARQVRFATERWADEVAARAVGDRPLVARAIIKAALTSEDDTLLPAASGGHVAARVDALLGQTPTRRHRRWANRATTVSVVVTVAAAVIQVHHLAVYLTHAGHGHF